MSDVTTIGAYRTSTSAPVLSEPGRADWKDLHLLMSPRQLYTVSVTLPSTTAEPAEISAVLQARLPRSCATSAIDRHRRLVVAITIAATDIWLAVLIVMNAITSTGHEPTHLSVEQATDTEADEYNNA